MKTKRMKTIIGTLFLIAVLSACNKTDIPSVPGTIQLKALPASGLKSAALQTSSGTLALQTAAIEIRNLVIEENSGNDVENNVQDNHSNDGADNETKGENGGSETDGGDIQLAGPFVLDIVNGAATIDQVEAQPGTYKKVDFDFYAGTENSGNSIVIKGEYTSAAGAVVPFELTSPLASTVQLPLTNALTVTSGSAVTVSIVFDLQSWLAGLDFENAALSGNKITISPQQNTDLYAAFTDAVNQHIDVED